MSQDKTTMIRGVVSFMPAELPEDPETSDFVMLLDDGIQADVLLPTKVWKSQPDLFKLGKRLCLAGAEFHRSVMIAAEDAWSDEATSE
jgi:hypothetical protein